MNSVDSMHLYHVAITLPPDQLQSECDDRESLAEIAAISVAVAVGVVAYAGMIYGAYRLCDSYGFFLSRIVVAKDGSQFEVEGLGSMIMFMSGALPILFTSLGVGFLAHMAARPAVRRLLLTRMQELRNQVGAWSMDRNPVASERTPVASEHLVTLNRLARRDQLSALLSNMTANQPTMTVNQQLQLRAVVGTRAFERSILPGARVEVRAPWDSLHLFRGKATEIKAWLRSPTRLQQFRVNRSYLTALAQILGEQRMRVSDLQPELSAFYTAVNHSDKGFDEFARHIELAANPSRELRDGFVKITVDGQSHVVHAGLMSQLPHLQSMLLTEAQRRLLPRYLHELHMTTLRPSVADDLPSADLDEMLRLIVRIGSTTDSMRHFERHLQAKRQRERDDITLNNLRQVWERGGRPEMGWMRQLCMEALRDPKRADHFKKDSLFALWPELDMPNEILAHVDPRSQEVQV